jgi:competence protein ComGC
MKKILILLLSVLMLVFVSCKKDNTTEPTKTDCDTQLEVAKKCKAILPDCDDEKLKTSLRCLGTNANGITRCSNKTTNPCGYCTTHKSQWTGTCPNETKNACGYCEDHKDQYSK